MRGSRSSRRNLAGGAAVPAFSKHLEAFLEMLAAERGAARLDARRLPQRPRRPVAVSGGAPDRPRGRGRSGAARLSRGGGDRAAGAAQPGAAALGDAPVLQVSGRRRGAAGRSDGRSRHAAARPSVAEDAVGKRGRRSARGSARLARRGGRAPPLPDRAALCDRNAHLGTGGLPLAAALRDPRFLLVRGKGGQGAGRAAERAGTPGARRLSRMPRALPVRGTAVALAVPVARRGRPSDPPALRPIAEGAGAEAAGSTRLGCRRTCCAMPSPAICSITAPICAACSRCWGMPTSQRRRSIRTSSPTGCAGWCTPRTRSRGANDAPFSRFRTADRRARRQDRRAAPPVDDRRAQHRRRGRTARSPGRRGCCARTMRG